MRPPQAGPASRDLLLFRLFRASLERASALGPRALASPVIHTADGAMRQALATEAAQRASGGDCQLVGMIAAAAFRSSARPNRTSLAPEAQIGAAIVRDLATFPALSIFRISEAKARQKTGKSISFMMREGRHERVSPNELIVALWQFRTVVVYTRIIAIAARELEKSQGRACCGNPAERTRLLLLNKSGVRPNDRDRQSKRKRKRI